MRGRELGIGLIGGVSGFMEMEDSRFDFNQSAFTQCLHAEYGREIESIEEARSI
jgi:hypothetical protein